MAEIVNNVQFIMTVSNIYKNLNFSLPSSPVALSILNSHLQRSNRFILKEPAISPIYVRCIQKLNIVLDNLKGIKTLYCLKIVF